MQQVEEITLLNTVLIKWDGHRIICPNAKLSTDLLINVTRSQQKGETFKVSHSFCAMLAHDSVRYAQIKDQTDCQRSVMHCGHSIQSCGVRLQVLVDISTLPEVFDRMEECVKEHINANPLDFPGEFSVNANFGGDPMKFALVIWWNYCYNGAQSRKVCACFFWAAPSL